MFKHMKALFSPESVYVPALHSVGLSLLTRNPKITKVFNLHLSS